VGGAAGGGSGAASAGAGVIGGNLGQQAGQKMGEAEADRLGLDGQARKDLVNSYQQFFATAGGAVGGMAGGAAAGNGGGTGALASGVQGGNAGYSVDVFNRQVHPTEAQWIKDNSKRFAQQQGISEKEAEKRLGQQAYRQVQDGAAGTWDADASTFLKQPHGMLAADPNCPTCGPGYMFQATAAQKANADMYANLLPQTVDFYARNGIQTPTPQQAAAGTQRGSNARDIATTQSLLAPVAAASAALAGLSPAVAAWALANPVAATNAGVITADVAAQIASGAVTPGTVAELMVVNTGNVAASGALEVVARYGPMNKGPLLADTANTFRSATYSEVITQQTTTLYRVYGGTAGELGGYWTRSPPSGPVQSIIDSALIPQWGNSATSVVKIEVPAGTKFYEGVAAAQDGLVGGGSQVLFPKDFKINSSWIKK
jgi:filamentous hemagglutinin